MERWTGADQADQPHGWSVTGRHAVGSILCPECCWVTVSGDSHRLQTVVDETHVKKKLLCGIAATCIQPLSRVLQVAAAVAPEKVATLLCVVLGRFRRRHVQPKRKAGRLVLRWLRRPVLCFLTEDETYSQARSSSRCSR